MTFDWTIDVSTILGFLIAALPIAFYAGVNKRILDQMVENQHEHDKRLAELEEYKTSSHARITGLEVLRESRNHKEVGYGS